MFYEINFAQQFIKIYIKHTWKIENVGEGMNN